MIKKKIDDVENEVVTKANSTQTTVRWLITKDDGPTHFATRRFEIQPGGEVGLHQHTEEHHIYVLEGEAGFYNKDGFKFAAKRDEVIFIPPNEPHSIKNDSDKIFSFICIIP
ncbi:MAG: cupin domain-containing protein [Candidatus Lokiarchaeota archaeon]|nr:cupin domain-containing protein [Candidatus Lokiarchaeota archaeon]